MRTGHSGMGWTRGSERAFPTAMVLRAIPGSPGTRSQTRTAAAALRGCFPPAALPGPRGAAARMLAAGPDMAAPSAALRQRRAAAAGGSGAPETPGRAAGPESAGGGVGPPLSPGTFWLTRIVLLRAVALLYRECPGAAAAPRSLSRERVGDGPALRAARLAASRTAAIPEGLGLLVVLRAVAGRVERCEGLRDPSQSAGWVRNGAVRCGTRTQPGHSTGRAALSPTSAPVVHGASGCGFVFKARRVSETCRMLGGNPSLRRRWVPHPWRCSRLRMGPGQPEPVGSQPVATVGL